MLHRLTWLGWLGLLGCVGPSVGHPVRPGIEVLLTDSLHLLDGRRVGLLTNQTGVARDGTGDVELLLAAGVQLKALFSPEHGFRGVLDQSTVAHSTDSATGLPIYSLYGPTREPTPAMLSGIDVLVIDLQDIGSRTYTYLSTALLAMRAAGAAGRDVIVADRPNPLGGMMMQGPVLDSAFASFVGMVPVPQRHGMTIGELTRLGREVLALPVRLVVIPAVGWRREQWFDATGLPWVRPSPNMPDLESATHYPGLVWFEATNLSVGRGTPIAFQVVGAPWLDPGAVQARLGMEPGVSIADTTIVPEGPTDGKYDGVRLPALRFLVTDRGRYDSSRLAFRLLETIAAIHGDSLVIRSAAMDRLAGTDRLRLALRDRDGAEQLPLGWAPALARFARTREPYLLY